MSDLSWVHQNSEAAVEYIKGLEQERDALASHVESLRSRANTWNRVWGELRNTQLIKDIGYEHAKHGNYSAASILLEAFETLTEQVEDEQTSLAEVRARAVDYNVIYKVCCCYFDDSTGYANEVASRIYGELMENSK